jgi:hypothetical protein
LDKISHKGIKKIISCMMERDPAKRYDLYQVLEAL